MSTPTTPDLHQADLFVSGQGGYHTYRIPSLLVTATGTILAFCEGRRYSSSDSGDIDIVLRRSIDNGDTWSEMQLVADAGPDVFGNPCPVQDRATRHDLAADQLEPGRRLREPDRARRCAARRVAAAER